MLQVQEYGRVCRNNDLPRRYYRFMVACPWLALTMLGLWLGLALWGG